MKQLGIRFTLDDLSQDLTPNLIELYAVRSSFDSLSSFIRGSPNYNSHSME